MTSTASIDGRHNVISENAKGSEIRPPLQQKREMSDAYPPCHCLLDSAGYLGLVKLLVCRRCQIARRLSGKPGQPGKLHKSVISRQNGNETRRERAFDETQTAGKARPFAVSLLRRSVADAYPSPYAVTPTVDHRSPAHHAVAAIGVGPVVGAAVARSSAKAEPERESGREAPAPTAATPSATMPAASMPTASVPTAPSGVGRRRKREGGSCDCGHGGSGDRHP